MFYLGLRTEKRVLTVALLLQVTQACPAFKELGLIIITHFYFGVVNQGTGLLSSL